MPTWAHSGWRRGRKTQMGSIPAVRELWVPEPVEGMNIPGQFVKHNRFSIGPDVGHS
jgi:hypothetical protein